MTPDRAIKILERRTVEGDQFMEIVESLTQENPYLELWFEKRKRDGVYLMVEGVEHRVKVECINPFTEPFITLRDEDIPQLCDVVVEYLEQIESSTDAKPKGYTNPLTEARDKWVYEKKKKGASNKDIMEDLNKLFVEKDWESLTTPQAVRTAVKRYEDNTGAPKLPRSKGGRGNK